MGNLLLLITIVSLGTTTTFAASLNGAATDDLLRPYFSHLDKDGDGTVSLEDLRTLSGELNLRTYLSDENIKSVFNGADMNGDGHIGYEDFDLYLGLALDSMFQGLLREVDRDNNRQIGLGEAKEALKANYREMDLPSGLGRQSFEDLNDELDAELPKLIKSLDKNDDDQISLAEVKDAVREVIQEAIRTVDTDGDDKISLEELKNIADPDTLPATVMKIVDENGDGHFSYAEFKNEAKDQDPLNSVHKALGRLDAALNGGGRTAVEWRAYASIVGCGILVSMQL